PLGQLTDVIRWFGLPPTTVVKGGISRRRVDSTFEALTFPPPQPASASSPAARLASVRARGLCDRSMAVLSSVPCARYRRSPRPGSLSRSVGGPAQQRAQPSPQPPPKAPGTPAEPPAAEPAGRNGRADQLHPVVQRQLAGDQPPQRRGHRRADPGALQRERQQRDRLQRLDRLADLLGDLRRGDAR